MGKFSKVDLQQEREANAFALCLLMPKDMFLKAWCEIRLTERDEEKQIIHLAKLFQVPLSTVPIRISMLTDLETVNKIINGK
jgi:Zn-dependent peptidase ImmA (M78 family)